MRSLLLQLLLATVALRFGQGAGVRPVAAAKGNHPRQKREQPAPVVGVRAHQSERVDAEVEGDDYGRKRLLHFDAHRHPDDHSEVAEHEHDDANYQPVECRADVPVMFGDCKRYIF